MAPRRPPVQHHGPEPPAGTVIRVYRHTPADHFTIVPNALARGRLPVPLRALARCLLIHLLSLPAGWEITRAEINRAFVEGRDAVSAGIGVQRVLDRDPASVAVFAVHRASDLSCEGGLRTRIQTKQGGELWKCAPTPDPGPNLPPPNTWAPDARPASIGGTS